MGGQKPTQTWTPTKRRGPIAAEFSTPGPAAIGLPSTFALGKGTNVTVKSRAPSFTISGRHEIKHDSAGPGPGQYNINGLSCKGKDEPSAPSMHIRPKDPRPFVTPAPGDYCPEKSKKVLDQAPKFSFGMKIENNKGPDVPAPNCYNIPSLIGSAKPTAVHQQSPSFTMSGRPRDEEDKMKIPGPGTYNEAIVDKYKTAKSPAFSMGQRTNIPSDHTRKPGPGAHSPEKCMQDHGPQFTISGRPKELRSNGVPGPGTYKVCDLNVYLEKQPVHTLASRTEPPTDKTPKPSPNAYYPEKCLQDEGPKYSMGVKLSEVHKTNVPGPGSYNAGELDYFLEKSPVYTMRPRTELPTDKSPKPSPNAYSPEKCLQDEGPKYSMGAKLSEVHKMNVPGPGSYNAGELDYFLEKSPVYSMRPRTELPTDKTPKPSPNAYCPEKYVADEGPKFTMAPRLKEVHKVDVPGPGTYEAGSLNSFLERKPAFTMAPKTEIPVDKCPKPAPNAYCPEKALRRETPEFSFGVKHSQYLGKLRDQ